MQHNIYYRVVHRRILCSFFVFLVSVMGSIVTQDQQYRVLGLVAQTSSLEDIKQAYRRLALYWHPDKNNHPQAAEYFIAIARAYNSLLYNDHSDNFPVTYFDNPCITHTIFDAIKNNDRALLHCIIQRDGKSSVTKKELLKNTTPLFTAVSYRNPVLVKKLLTYPQNIDEPCVQGLTALHQAARIKEYTILKLLLENGANSNAQDNYLNTPLHWAVKDAFINYDLAFELVTVLLAYGASVNAKDDYEGTPLHIAAACANVKIVEYLVAQGADVYAVTKRGERPLDMARRLNSDVRVVEYLEQVTATWWDIRHWF